MTFTVLELNTIKELASEIEIFQLEFSADDIDMNWSTVNSFRHLAKRFVGACKLINEPVLNNLLADIYTDINCETETADLHAELLTIAAYVQRLPDTLPIATFVTKENFISLALISDLAATKHPEFDTTKLIQFCKEINSSYVNENVVATVLLIRALINHVPPIFGYKTFKQVVSHSGRSLKAVLEPLENQARPISDLHNHILIRKSEYVPTFAQVEPFRAALENLLQEILNHLNAGAD